MDGSEAIFIVMPIVIVVVLLVLIVLPFVGDRGSGGSRSGGAAGHQNARGVIERSRGGRNSTS